MPYTPPAGNAVNFNFTGGTYTPPLGNNTIFNFAGVVVTGPFTSPWWVGAPYPPGTFVGTGGTPPYSYTVSGQPTGLTIGSSSGILSGTPSLTDPITSYSVTVTATDSLLLTGSLTGTIVLLPALVPVTQNAAKARFMRLYWTKFKKPWRHPAPKISSYNTAINTAHSRVTFSGIEVLSTGPNGNARVSWSGLEVLSTGPNGNARVSWSGVEVLASIDAVPVFPYLRPYPLWMRYPKRRHVPRARFHASVAKKTFPVTFVTA
jgi:hypothetical protein